MYRLLSDRFYGLFILSVMLTVGLYMAYDAQASMHNPGWFAGLRSSVWCQTMFYGPQFGEGTLFHYPGKSLARVTKELGIPFQIRALYLNADRQETVCFDSWQEAAYANGKFKILAQEYGAVLADWREVDYQQAVVMINLQSGGTARLTELLKLKQRSLEQSH